MSDHRSIILFLLISLAGKKCFALFGVFGSLVAIYSIQLLTGSVSTIVTLFKGPAFQPDVLQGAFTYLTISLPAISGAVQVCLKIYVHVDCLYKLESPRCYICLYIIPECVYTYTIVGSLYVYENTLCIYVELQDIVTLS